MSLEASALRALYRSLDRPFASAVAQGTARTLATLSRSSPDGWLSAFERRFVRSGWPGHGTNWVNLHTSRFLNRVRREMRGAPALRPRSRSTERTPLRVGIVGRFVGLLGFPAALFEARPSHVDLTLFDAPYAGRRADYLRSVAATYVPIDLAGPGPHTRDAAGAIAAADLDLLLNVNAKQDAHDLLDIVQTGCVANYCSGSDFLHHPRVDVELLWQLQPSNEIRDGRLWCTDANLPVGDTFVYQISGLYDRRGLDGQPMRPWSERDPLIVSHGSLYKFAVPAFLTCLLDVLERDPEAEWILVGKDDGRALADITAAARGRGLSNRVHYEGEFSSVRNADGVIDDPRWKMVEELLRRARLAPDPFPVGSGSARFEAYLLGAPSPHMSAHGEGSRQLASCELPVLSVPVGTADTIEAYRDLSMRCLSEAAVASAMQQAQLAAAVRASDPIRWWNELTSAYHAWSHTRAAA